MIEQRQPTVKGFTFSVENSLDIEKDRKEVFYAELEFDCPECGTQLDPVIDCRTFPATGGAGLTLFKSPWISVEDRLPEGYADVLTYSPRDEWQVFNVGLLDEDAPLDRCLAFLFQDDESRIVTHWMPLPDPPKEK